MKTEKLNLSILIVLLTSVFAYSQSWQPKKITKNNEAGLFLPITIMDSLTVKLIERNSLLHENSSLGGLNKSLNKENDILADKVKIVEDSSLKWELLYGKEKEKALLLELNIQDFKKINISVKKRARKNNLLFLGGGAAAGFVGAVLLSR